MLYEVITNGLNAKCGLLVNSSRGIIYASSESDFAEKARLAAVEVQQEMEVLLKENVITSYSIHYTKLYDN